MRVACCFDRVCYVTMSLGFPLEKYSADFSSVTKLRRILSDVKKAAAAMFSVRTARMMAEGFLPNPRKIYQAIMEDTRQILHSLERRCKLISQQQFIFVTALDRCRKQRLEPTRTISTIAQVHYYYSEVTENATDKRIFSIFLSLVHDLSEFRRTLAKVARNKNDERLKHLFKKWKKLLEPRQDISEIRATYPNDQINHLSCDESRNHFGGIISLIPVAMDFAREVVVRIESTRAYRPGKDGTNCTGAGAREDHRKQPHNKFHPRFRTTPDVSPRQKQECARNMNNGDADSVLEFAVVGTSSRARLQSPTISSPVLSSASSLSSVMRTPSQRSVRVPFRQQSRRPRPATPEYDHVTQCVQTSDAANRVRPATAGKATQTPKLLLCTLRPKLVWPHQSVSEDEIRRLIRSRNNVELQRPNWKN